MLLRQFARPGEPSSQSLSASPERLTSLSSTVAILPVVKRWSTWPRFVTRSPAHKKNGNRRESPPGRRPPGGWSTSEGEYGDGSLRGCSRQGKHLDPGSLGPQKGLGTFGCRGAGGRDRPPEECGAAGLPSGFVTAKTPMRFYSPQPRTAGLSFLWSL